MSNLIQVEQLNEAIKGALDNYNSAIIKGVKQNVKRAMKDLVTNTASSAPVGNRRTEHYKDYITSRTVENTDTSLIMEWYVKDPNYRLSHLLEKGHATKNGGYVPGLGFISRNLDAIETWYQFKIEEVIRNAK